MIHLTALAALSSLSRTVALLAVLGTISAADPVTVNTDGTVVMGTDPGGSELVRIGGTTRINGDIMVQSKGGGNSFGVTNSTYGSLVAWASFGYSPGTYSTLQVGVPGRGVALGVNPGSVAGSSLFGGAGSEVLFSRNSLLLQPNATSTDWERATFRLGGIVLGTDPAGTELLRVGGPARINGDIVVPAKGGGNSFGLTNATYGSLISWATFGYNPGSYTTLQVGAPGRGVALGVNPGSVAGTSFGGGGSEVLFSRNALLLQPNAASTDWERATFRLGGIVLGTDPTGTELLRVGGGIKASGGIISTSLNTSSARVVKTRSITATTILDATDDAVKFSGATTGQTITLPAASEGRRLYIKNRGTVAVTIACNGANTIDGLATKSLPVDVGVTLVAFGTDWSSY